VAVYLAGKLVEPKRTPNPGLLARALAAIVANRLALTVVILAAAGYWVYTARTSAAQEFTVTKLVTANAEVKKQLSKVPDVTSWTIASMAKGSLRQQVQAAQVQFLTTYVLTLRPQATSGKYVKVEVDTRLNSVTSMDLCTTGSGAAEDCKILYDASTDQANAMRQLARSFGQRGPGGFDGGPPGGQGGGFRRD
jgi:hypothetical protein